MISKATVAIVFVCLFVGAAAGGWYVKRKSDEWHANREYAQLYNDAVRDKKTYSKLLQFVHNDEKERVSDYLEALLVSATSMIESVKSYVPEEIRSRVDSGSLDYMGDYKDVSPALVGNSPKKALENDAQ